MVVFAAGMHIFHEFKKKTGCLQISFCEQWSSGALAHRCGRACNWDTMKRLHVRTTYSAYSTLVKIYKLVSGFDLLCVGRWLPRRAILSGTCTSGIQRVRRAAWYHLPMRWIFSPCFSLNTTSMYLSFCASVILPAR